MFIFNEKLLDPRSLPVQNILIVTIFTGVSCSRCSNILLLSLFRSGEIDRREKGNY